MTTNVRKWKRDRRVTEFEFAFACCTQSVAFALRGCPGEGGGLLLHDKSQRKAPRSVNTNRYMNLFAAGWDLHFTNEILLYPLLRITSVNNFSRWTGAFLSPDFGYS